MSDPAKDRRAFFTIGAASLGASAFLLWLIYWAPAGQADPALVARLPHVNACLNALSSLFMVAGVLSIKAGLRERHKRLMLAALASSALFLISYVAYHHFHGDTKYPGTGFLRPVYFFILISHIILSIVVLPLLLTVVYFAGMGAFERHKPLARWVFPLWLYVSVSGVAVYLFLRPYY